MAIAGVVPARYIYIRKCQFVPTLLTSGPLRQLGSHDKAEAGTASTGSELSFGQSQSLQTCSF